MTRMNHAILVLIRFISSCVINNHTRNMEYFETTGMNPEDYIKEGKPEESFSQLIKRAISSSSRQRLFLTEIYSWILENYPYYKQVDPGWRNSVRHSLSTTKEFVRIKETRQKFNRGSEWCLSDSELGKWYVHLTEREQGRNSNCPTPSQEFSKLVELSTLIPELTSSIIPISPDRPVLIDLENYPDYLLGLVPHPELFVLTTRKTPSPQSSEFYLTRSNQFPISISNSFLGSPLSRKATPKPFDMGTSSTNLNLDFETEIGNEFLDFN